MTSSGTNLQSGQIIQQQPTQVVIQQQSQQQQTIRKVGSSGNLSSLQQKVQVFNRPSIQIVQAGAQRAKTASTTINATGQNTQNNLTTTNVNTGNSTNATTTSSSGPLQFQQVFQQQHGAAKLTTTTQQPTS